MVSDSGTDGGLVWDKTPALGVRNDFSIHLVPVNMNQPALECYVLFKY